VCACARVCVLSSMPLRQQVLAVLCKEEIWCVLPCVAEHKSPSRSLSGKAVSSLGTLPLWALGSLWGVTGQPAEEATSCEM